MAEKILIMDFGSQYTQLIARAVREANVFCEILPYSHKVEPDPFLKGIILSGSPFSVNDKEAPEVDVKQLAASTPVLGICYGAQLTAKQFEGKVEKSNKREYGRAVLHIEKEEALLKNLTPASQVWMSHGDTILKLPKHFELLATTDSIPVAAFKCEDASLKPLYGLQFHPEVYHSIEGKKVLQNFLVNICGCSQNWTPAHFISETVASLKKQIGDEQVIMALSGGVDSTVAAMLIHKAIGKNLHGVFVDNGVLRKDEFENVLSTYKELGLNVKGVNAKKIFYRKLKDQIDPEAKRKAIGKTFIKIFQREATEIKNVAGNYLSRRN
jgi:GMP synthase (glutamine-hydrolysing)